MKKFIILKMYNFKREKLECIMTSWFNIEVEIETTVIKRSPTPIRI